MSQAFFMVHRDLNREGPGLPEDVHWVLNKIPAPNRVLDAASGPGADTETFALALPNATIAAVDWQQHFAEAARARTSAFGARVSCAAGDMFAVDGPFDLIWCAGAAYFAGVTESLTHFRAQLAPGGHVAFSEPLAPASDAPAAAHAFWDDYPALTDFAGIKQRIEAAGYTCLATRPVVGAAWAAYYTPMQARIDALRPTAGADLLEALNEAQAEIDGWRAAQDHIVYLLCLVRPNDH